MGFVFYLACVREGLDLLFYVWWEEEKEQVLLCVREGEGEEEEEEEGVGVGEQNSFHKLILFLFFHHLSLQLFYYY